jgi:hypothetical protein
MINTTFQFNYVSFNNWIKYLCTLENNWKLKFAQHLKLIKNNDVFFSITLEKIPWEL